MALDTPAANGAPRQTRRAQLRAPYLEALVAYGHRAPERLHVPGHGGGRGADPALASALGLSTLSLDVPRDIDGIDLGPAPTPYEQAEQLAAEAYGAARTWFLTNGASQGNHAICLALAPAGAEIVVQRNCHGSVTDGLILSGGSPHYVFPGYDAERGIATVVTPEQLQAALRERPGAAAATIVSPTYFGMVADVAGCASVAHDAGVPLIVDCAWGPHLGFHPSLPPNPLHEGADIVLTSTHKHAGSLTQSAMLHVAAGRPDLHDALDRTIRLLRSTSPSSLLLASLDASRRQLAVRGTRLLGDTLAAAERLRDRIAAVPGCRLLDREPPDPAVWAWDPLRIVVDVHATGIAASTLAHQLRDVHDTQLELHTHTTLVLVVPLGMDEPTAHHVATALEAAIAISATDGAAAPSAISAPGPIDAAAPHRTPRDAFLGPVETVNRESAIGRISAEAISAYPPGIPTLLPGEPITAAAIDQLVALHAAGLRLHGASDPDLRTLRVCAR